MEEKETRIMSFFTQKGGSGKTTLTHMTSIALAAEAMGKKILVIDADTQQSLIGALDDIRNASGKSEITPPYDLLSSAITKVTDVLRENWGKYDFILIDLPGTMDMEGVRTALLACDIIFIPVQPSPFDLKAAADTVKKLQEIKEFKQKNDGDLKYYLCLNQAEVRNLSTKRLIEYIGSSGMKYISSPMARYEQYKYILNDYSNILDKETTKWGNEEIFFSNFFNEINNLITT